MNLSSSLPTFFYLVALLFSSPSPAAEHSLYPLNSAANINPDLHLRITFADPPAISSSGKIRIYDAKNDRLVDTLDLSIHAGPTERATGPKAPYTPEPYIHGPSSLTNANTKPGTPSGRAAPTLDTYQLTIIGGFTDGFHFYPIIVHENTAIINLHHNLLEYGKNYYVEIDAGILSTSTGPFLGFSGKKAWTFSTKPHAPDLASGSITVNAAGTGDFDTIQGAIDFVPDNHKQPVEIYIHNGIYEEIVYFRNKTDLTLRGESREGVVARYANREVFNPHPSNLSTNEYPGTFPSRRAAFMADNCSRLLIESMTIQNLCQRAQAEGLLINGSENVIRDVTIIGSGDALQTNGSAYYEKCRIDGEGDTILGRGPAFFKNCSLSSPGPYMWIRNTNANHGNVFLDCVFETPDQKETVLARAPTNGDNNYPYAEAVLINCKLSGIAKAGWGSIGGDPSKIRYWEFNSVALENGGPVDVSERHPASRQLTLPADKKWIESYSNPAFVLGSWAAEL